MKALFNMHWSPVSEGGGGVPEFKPVNGTEQNKQITPQLSEPETDPEEQELSPELEELFGRKHSVPLDLDVLPGFIRDFVDWTTKCTDARPGLLVTAFLPHCAANLGNRVFMVHNSVPIYPNIWSCVIGPSSISRKSTALRYSGFALQTYADSLEGLPLEEFEQKMLVLNGVTLSKLMSYLSINPNRLFVHNELASWLGEMSRSFNAGYRQVVTELFDGVDRLVANRERTERIRKPALSIAAATTEGGLYRNMHDSADQLSGFLQRMLFYVVREWDDSQMDQDDTDTMELMETLSSFYEVVFKPWREIPGSFQLRLSEEAKQYRKEEYAKRYAKCFQKRNDALLSYFTRIYDAYWFKFCILGTLGYESDNLAQAIAKGECAQFFETLRVDRIIAQKAMKLCDFYMENTRPFLAMMEEEDKLSGEKRLVELIITKFHGKAPHSALMNTAHMKKREFMEHIENLIERGAIRVETVRSRNNSSARVYVIAPSLMKEFNSKRTN